MFAILLAALALAALFVWLYLILLRGLFWRADQELEEDLPGPANWPGVVALVPARNEADVIEQTLDTLLMQDYEGPFHVILIDDHSEDGTTRRALAVAKEAGLSDKLTVIPAGQLPPGWSGKVWALSEGLTQAGQVMPQASYVWLTDADIGHWLSNLSSLVAKAEAEDLDMVSIMAQLNCESFWERLLIPPFVFFFQKLYPFRWVNKPKRQTAAAAGGCMLIHAGALMEIGGFAAIKDELIDDIALATKIKEAARPHGRGIWLGLGSEAISLRPYDELRPIWDMVARSAYTQLDHSPRRLAAVVAGMALAYLVPPLAIVGGLYAGLFLDASVAGDAALALFAGAGAMGLMALAAWPTYRLYNEPFAMTLALPLAALFYTAMTLDSARRHRKGKGGTWKGRVHGPAAPKLERRAAGRS